MAKRTPRLSPQILEDATAWFIEFNENAVDVQGRDEFNAWLRRSPEHVQAYLQISAFWEDAAILEKRPGLDIAALVARAQKEHNVYPLEAEIRSGAARVRGRSAAALPRLAWAATLVLSIGAVATWYFTHRGVYATDIGEQRSIALTDGSSLELNSRSRVKVHFTEGERGIELLQGQVLFRVAKDANRPFRVRAGETVVRAVGTVFDVYKKSTGTTVVTVVEGRVAVTEANREPREGVDRVESGTRQLLSAGDQLIVAAAAAPAAMAKPERADVAKATAWTERRLVFQSTPLQEVVEEFNRYNRRQLVIRDPELYAFHVSGVFPSTDSSRMIEFLRQRFGVRTQLSEDEVEIFRPH